MNLDVDKSLETLRNNQILTEREVRILCELCKEIFFEESNIHVTTFNSACSNACHNLRRHPRPILRPPRIISPRRRAPKHKLYIHR